MKLFRNKTKERLDSIDYQIKRLQESVNLLSDLLQLDGRPYDDNAIWGITFEIFSGNKPHHINLGNGIVRTLSNKIVVSDSLPTKAKK